MTFPRASARSQPLGHYASFMQTTQSRALESGVYLLSEKALGDLRSPGPGGGGALWSV